ncbi:hypothetical protein CA13_53330 [Planctomycetes bacterium CA13]|uniref:Uncharacterized protein n=1 Tax=Novipirellula herctigrandis TaxID=2527986 RepID=A0A5C5Z9I7_9BACT|nr:hypothetical protein CA13_53330 [Planctomycetes bacterium CA13]
MDRSPLCRLYSSDNQFNLFDFLFAVEPKNIQLSNFVLRMFADILYAASRPKTKCNCLMA